MKIRFNKETYINNPCPSLTKDMMNWFYQELYVRFRNNFDVNKVNSIESINVRINQAYKGCSNIHFYVSINNMEEFHMKYESIPSYYTVHEKRYDWLVDFIQTGGIDMGTMKPIEWYEERWRIKKEKRNTSERVKYLRRQYETFLKLKELFNYES